MMHEKLERKLAKLLALAERGVGGEKEVAKEMLGRLMDKHGITIDQLTGDVKTMRWLKWGNGKINRRLLCQIFNHVCGNEISIYTTPNRKATLGAEITDAEYIEVELKFTTFKKGLSEQIDIAYQAFVHKHDIFPPQEDSNGDNRPELSAEERAKVKRMLAMSDVMPGINIRREIGE